MQTPLAHEPLVRTSSRIPVGRWVLAASLLLLNLIDVVLTRWVIRAGGAEGNPLMRNLVEDPFAGYAVKLAVCLGVGVLLVRSPKNSRLADRATLFVVVLYLGVIGWNLHNLWRAGQLPWLDPDPFAPR